MIRAEDLGETTKLEIEGKGESLMIELAQIIKRVKKNYA